MTSLRNYFGGRNDAASAAKVSRETEKETWVKAAASDGRRGRCARRINTPISRVTSWTDWGDDLAWNPTPRRLSYFEIRRQNTGGSVGPENQEKQQRDQVEGLQWQNAARLRSRRASIGLERRRNVGMQGGEASTMAGLKTPPPTRQAEWRPFSSSAEPKKSQAQCTQANEGPALFSALAQTIRSILWLPFRIRSPQHHLFQLC